MIVNVQLMGVLEDCAETPPNLELPEATTLGQLLSQLGLESYGGLTFSINNSIVRDRQTLLHDGDRLVIVPPAIGG